MQAAVGSSTVSGLSTEFLFKMHFFLNKKLLPGPRVFIPCQSHELWGLGVGRGGGSLFFISLFHQRFAEMSPIDKWDKSKKTLEIAVLCCVIMLNNPGESSLKHIYYCLGLNKFHVQCLLLCSNFCVVFMEIEHCL